MYDKIIIKLLVIIWYLFILIVWLIDWNPNILSLLEHNNYETIIYSKQLQWGKIKELKKQKTCFHFYNAYDGLGGNLRINKERCCLTKKIILIL